MNHESEISRPSPNHTPYKYRVCPGCGEKGGLKRICMGCRIASSISRSTSWAGVL